MWRNALILNGGLLVLVGCASTQPPPMPVQPAHSGPAAAALAFTPPVAYGQPSMDLWRDQRQAQAFVGFDQPSISSYRLRQDDEQRHGRFGANDRFERRAIIQQTAVRTR
jgi:hypothetical protein